MPIRPGEPLTPRETEILTLLVQGLPNAAIAGRLGMALSSIKWYVRQIYAKLGVKSRRDAAARAEELGLDEHIVSGSAPDRIRAGREGRQSNVPVPRSSFVGRTGEMATVKQLLVSPAVRLLTLTGPAGCGKTRLAREVAAELVPALQGGVGWIDLAPLTDPALVPQGAASALNVSERPGQTTLDALVRHLHAAKTLLVLDNCEHLIAACGELAQALLAACPDLKLLATSREALAVAGEITWPVPPLSLPPSDRLPVTQLMESEAICLFVERARASLSTFVVTEHNADSVAQVCRRLDGIPLAIELAAARIKVLAAAQIAERLDDALGLLRRGGGLTASRHETLGAALDWSHNLLSSGERALLRRLAVFSGGFALEAAEAVCGRAPLESHQILDTLSDLVDHSLIEVGSPSAGIRRFRMLEIVHQYAGEKLEAAGEFIALHDRHFDWCLALVEQAQPELYGPRQAEWVARLEQERGNLRAALGWSLDQPDRVESGIRVAFALAQFWQLRGDFAEGLAWLERLHARGAGAALPLRANLLEAEGLLRLHWGSSDDAQRAIEQAAALYQEAGDSGGVGRQLHLLAHVALGRGEPVKALEFAGQALQILRAAGDQWWISACLFALGDGAFLQGDLGRAAKCYEESLALCRETGHAFAIARRLVRLGQVARARSDLAEARKRLADGLALARQVGDNWGVTMAVGALGALMLAEGQPERAAGLLGAAQARLDSIAAHFWPLDRFEYDRTLQTLDSMLGPEAAGHHADQGRALSLEQAVTYALEPAEPDERVPQAADSGRPAGLTKREAEILGLIAAGESNRAIADELVLSLRTVERHTANIYQKLGITGPAARTAAASYAFRHGLGPALPTSSVPPKDT